MSKEMTIEELENSESGGRSPTGIAKIIVTVLLVSWALWQFIAVSPLIEFVGFSQFSSSVVRPMHLIFAASLAFLLFPSHKNAPLHRIPILDWVFAVAALISVGYLIVFKSEIASRLGAPTQLDLIIGTVGMVVLLEATRRALGLALVVVAVVLLCFALFREYMPDILRHENTSFAKLLSHQWFTSEGVFGVAIGVSSEFVFLFVLFAALLDKAGAGQYIIKISFALLGGFRGGPAKAAVLASGLSGIVSGSSISNVVTTGTFTIPLMKKVGFPGTKAAAIEVAASTNGQLTPPMMGAAAFLMMEYLNISYLEVIRHAILPSLISYIALLYIVHLEALKADMKGLPRKNPSTLVQIMTSFSFVIFILSALGFIIYYGFSWIKVTFPESSALIAVVILLVAYVSLIKYSSNYPSYQDGDQDTQITELPEVGPTAKSGFYFLLPIVLLLWCILVERFSAGYSAFWACCFMIFILITHEPILAYFKKEKDWSKKTSKGFIDLFEAFQIGSKNMIAIGVATAAAGIIVGTFTLTGLGLLMTDLIEFLSGGNVIVMLMITAVVSLLLGLGLPTTANYIVVSTLMAPIIVALGAQNGLVVPLIAVHLFVFYFGILADDTPPVGLAAFAAAAIAKSDPIKTGIQGFMYDIRTAILPFMFIFNTQLLLIGIHSVFEFVLVVSGAILAMMTFSAATQGYWLTKSKIYETLGLLLITFLLFRPGYVWDKFYPPYEQVPSSQLSQVVANLGQYQPLRMRVQGFNIEGKEVNKTVMFDMPDELKTKEARLDYLGLEYEVVGDQVTAYPIYDSLAYKQIESGSKILFVEKPLVRPSKYYVYIPTFAFMFLLGFLQMRRSRKV
ncbi:MAG: TRAP transporter permease [Saccharospirillaceae bacterium]|nr:TRAP transporter permease [Saccharospirillaceae bacterium]